MRFFSRSTTNKIADGQGGSKMIEEHLDRAEDDLDKLQADYEAVLRRSQEAHERRYDQAYFSDLTKRLDAANKSLRHFHLYGHMQ
jgi:hypothetical protein